MWLVLEGVDGVGKSTLSDRLAADLSPVHRVREPGGTPFGDWVRGVTKGREARYKPPASEHGRRVMAQIHARHPWLDSLPDVGELDAGRELLLFLAARADVYGAITSRHDRVIQDRGMLSTYAYQAHEPAARAELDRWAPIVWPQRPTMTLLLDVDPSVSLERASLRGGDDRFEQRGIDYFERVRGAYLAAAAIDDSVAVIDASRSVDEVHAAAHDALAGVLRTR